MAGRRPADRRVERVSFADFVGARTAPAVPPLVPELVLFQAAELVPLWEAAETWAGAPQPAPFWAFCWPGGQVLGRWVLDHPDRVAGRAVLDFGCGGGIAALAAARAGGRVTAADIDPLAVAMCRINAAHNAVDVAVIGEDVIGRDAGWDVVLVGDMCYEQPLAARMTAWLAALARRGARVLIGDPGRKYLPPGLVERGRYTVPTSLELEARTRFETRVLELVPDAS